MKAKLIKDGELYVLKYGERFIGTSDNKLNSLVNYPFRLSIKNCEAIERGYDLDELAYNCSIEWHGEKFDSSIEIYKEAFQKALELMETEIKQLREFTKGFEEDWDFDGGWNCIVEMEDIQEIHVDGVLTLQPKLDADGCLILKRIP